MRILLRFGDTYQRMLALFLMPSQRSTAAWLSSKHPCPAANKGIGKGVAQLVAQNGLKTIVAARDGEYCTPSFVDFIREWLRLCADILYSCPSQSAWRHSFITIEHWVNQVSDAETRGKEAAEDLKKLTGKLLTKYYLWLLCNLLRFCLSKFWAWRAILLWVAHFQVSSMQRDQKPKI